MRKQPCDLYHKFFAFPRNMCYTMWENLITVQTSHTDIPAQA